MKIVHIYSSNRGSIGKIIADISKTLEQYSDIECYALLADCFGERPDNYVIFSKRGINKFNRILGRLTGFNNCFAVFTTRKLIRYLDQLQPEVIHLHNLHDGYVNLKILFNYLAKTNKPVVWTLHDCWAFTGKCPYFGISHCEKWKNGCFHCPTYKQYPKSEFDRTKYLYNLKKRLFTSMKKMALVTPSLWLADCVGQSYLQNIPVQVIYNGIDLEVFHPVESNIREKYGLIGKEIILGVAAPFDYRKGSHIFERLAKELPADKYVVVMIGLDEKQIANMPDNIIKIHRTSNQQELAEWYTSADVFVNPTYEEVLGMTNIEAMACGTPVITFSSGGSPETITEKTGFVVERDDYMSLYELLLSKKYLVISSDACIERAGKFRKENMTNEYIKLYESLS